MVESKQVDVIVVEFKDRLTRFGFDYLRRYFESHDVRLEIVEETEKVIWRSLSRTSYL